MLTVSQTGAKKKRICGDGAFVARIWDLKASSTRTMFCLNSAPGLVLHSWPLNSKDDYRSGCRNVNHRQQQQSYSLGTTFTRTIILNLATYEMTPEFKPFTITFLAENDTYHTFAAVSVMRSPLLTLNGFSVVYIPNLLNGAVATSGKTPICSGKIYNPPEH